MICLSNKSVSVRLEDAPCPIRSSGVAALGNRFRRQGGATCSSSCWLVSMADSRREPADLLGYHTDAAAPQSLSFDRRPKTLSRLVEAACKSLIFALDYPGIFRTYSVQHCSEMFKSYLLGSKVRLLNVGVLPDGGGGPMLRLWSVIANSCANVHFHVRFETICLPLPLCK
jgi:hypothetical protein